MTRAVRTEDRERLRRKLGAMPEKARHRQPSPGATCLLAVGKECRRAALIGHGLNDRGGTLQFLIGPDAPNRY